MIYWEEAALKDREKIFEYLYRFNPSVAEQTDSLIESRVEALNNHPLLGVQREGFTGRLLIIPDISMLISYFVDNKDIRVMRVLHDKQTFPSV